MDDSALEHRSVETNGIRLHTVLAGPDDGEPVILLHGFPEFWYGWRHQIDYLAGRGYRVIVPDQRGYNLSDKPESLRVYHLDTLAADIVGLMEALGYEQVFLAGHDWGAAVAWWVATLYPDRVHRLAILNVPYPTLLSQNLRHGDLRQLLKSWYIFFFQIPRLPEWALGRNAYQAMVTMLERSGNDTFSDADIRRYVEAWSQPGALTAMLNWYRAALRYRTLYDGGRPRVTVPTLILWGENDVALRKELAQQSVDLCEDGRLIYFPNATHWVQHDEAAAVNQHLSEFFQ